VTREEEPTRSEISTADRVIDVRKEGAPTAVVNIKIAYLGKSDLAKIEP